METNVAKVCPPDQEVSAQKYSEFSGKLFPGCYGYFISPTPTLGARGALRPDSSLAEDAVLPMVPRKASSQDSNEPSVGFD